jgi:hypothetical protein
MTRQVLLGVAFAVAVTALGGCGCGGSDGTGTSLGIAGPVAQAPGPDRSLIGPANAPIEGTETEEAAVVFTPAHAGMLASIDLLLSRGAVPGPVVIEVRRAQGDVPDADPAALLLSIPFDSAILSPIPGLATVDLTSRALAVSPGQPLAIVLRAAAGTAIWWQATTDWAPFAHAALRTRPAPGAPWGPWQASLDADFSFQTWVTAP